MEKKAILLNYLLPPLRELQLKILPPELGGEWLTEAEQRDKRAHTIKRQEK